MEVGSNVVLVFIRQAEIVTLLSNFDEFIVSSKMIEDELEAKLTNALSSYIDRTASHQV